ncbi:xylulokinase [Lentibacillus jeotgali]|uniref:xylulokinase n=1 Tax=Lentibacillus jeotgali TaxID=558169 RepID=UPI0002627C93|nr:FGGY family carbohydrate kinase [Lentibacillus jeotgali]
MSTYAAVFDIGTTAVKGALVRNDASFYSERTVELETHYAPDGIVEQNPNDWWDGVKFIAHQWWKEAGVDPGQVAIISFTGQMEDVIPITQHQTVNRAILYSDTRAVSEAEWLHQQFPEMVQMTGNPISATTPLAKLLQMKNRNQKIYDDTRCFLFGSKDFMIYRLTGAIATDPTTAATTGMMDVRTRRWETDIFSLTGIDTEKLPRILDAADPVGYVHKEAALETGFRPETPVLCGCGDAAASAIGAGAVKSGDSYCYIGTTGWIAGIQEDVNPEAASHGLFHLAHLPEKSIISVAPLLNAGNVYQWGADTFAEGQVNDRFHAFEALIRQSAPGSNGVLFLPYLQGERNPVNDQQAKGAFWGIGPQTKKCDLARAIIEGICFSLKQVMEVLNLESNDVLTTVGGGTKSSTWCQTLADILERPVRIAPENSYMSALGAVSPAFLQLGWTNDYEDFTDRFINMPVSEIFEPSQNTFAVYRDQYKQFLKMYPGLKGIYD